MEILNIKSRIALRKDIEGFDLRIIMLCYDIIRNQKELCELLNAKKSNVSFSVNKLINIGLLTRSEISGIYYYKINPYWK